MKSNEINEGKSHDDLLFHPCEDELNQNWLRNNIEVKNENCVSCSKCFSAISYSAGETKEKFVYQTKSVVAANLVLDQGKVI